MTNSGPCSPDVAFDDQIGALAQVQADGVARQIGLSNVNLAQLDRALQLVGGPERDGIVAVQNEYSPRYRRDACWGDNTGRLLGNGTVGGAIGDDETLDDLERHMLDGEVVQVRANAEATCARLDDGGVRCWGYGVYARLPIDIAMGTAHACAVGESGAVYCWGFPPSFGETNSWLPTTEGGYLDPATGLVKPLLLADPATCPSPTPQLPRHGGLVAQP